MPAGSAYPAHRAALATSSSNLGLTPLLSIGRDLRPPSAPGIRPDARITAWACLAQPHSSACGAICHSFANCSIRHSFLIWPSMVGILRRDPDNRPESVYVSQVLINRLNFRVHDKALPGTGVPQNQKAAKTAGGFRIGTKNSGYFASGILQLPYCVRFCSACARVASKDSVAAIACDSITFVNFFSCWAETTTELNHWSPSWKLWFPLAPASVAIRRALYIWTIWGGYPAPVSSGGNIYPTGA